MACWTLTVCDDDDEDDEDVGSLNKYPIKVLRESLWQ